MQEFSKSKAEPVNVMDTFERAVSIIEKEMTKNPAFLPKEIDTPNMNIIITALILMPADGNFTTAIAKGNRKAAEIKCQTRQHSELINLLDVELICVNKMDYDTTDSMQEKCDEISNKVKNTSIKIAGKDFIEKITHNSMKWHRMVMTESLNSAST